MRTVTLELIGSVLTTELGLSYAFLRWQGDVAYPYLIGEYTETAEADESGMMDTTFILTVFTRDTWLSLEEVRKTIQDTFQNGYRTVTDDGTGVAIYYASSFPIPQEDEELKRMQINLVIKEWRNY